MDAQYFRAVARIAIRGNEGDVWKCQVKHKVAPLEEQARGDPTAAFAPARHRGRMHQPLAQGLGDGVEIRRAGHGFKAQLAVGRDDEFNRALDAGAHHIGCVEAARQEQPLHKGGDVVVGRLQPSAEFPPAVRAERLAHEVPVELAGDEFGSRVLGQDDVDDVHAVEAPFLAQYALDAAVVGLGVEVEVEPPVVPASERTCGFAHIGFAVVADAHGEQLHDFPGEVLIRRALDVDPRIQEGQHRRILGHANQQVAEIAEAQSLKEPQLLEHLAVVAHLVLVGGKVPVPKQCHPLLQRTGA